MAKFGDLLSNPRSFEPGRATRGVECESMPSQPDDRQTLIQLANFHLG